MSDSTETHPLDHEGVALGLHPYDVWSSLTTVRAETAEPHDTERVHAELLRRQDPAAYTEFVEAWRQMGGPREPGEVRQFRVNPDGTTTRVT